MSDKKKKQTTSDEFMSFTDSLLIDLGVNYEGGVSDTNNTSGGNQQQDLQSKDLEGITQYYGQIKDYLDPNLLAAEAEEYMATGKTLGEGMDPWDWSDKNLNFKGWDFGYREGAKKEYDVPVPGYETYQKELHQFRPVTGKADQYFYNLALTQTYQKAAGEIAKSHNISFTEMGSMQGMSTGGYVEDANQLQSGYSSSTISPFSINLPNSNTRRDEPYLKKNWESYSGIIDKYADDDTKKALHQRASAQAFEWSNQYREDLRGKFQGVVKSIHDAAVDENTGKAIISLNKMLNITDDIDKYTETDRKLQRVSQQARSLDSQEILKLFKHIDSENIKWEGDYMKTFYDPDNPKMRTLINAAQKAMPYNKTAMPYNKTAMPQIDWSDEDFGWGTETDRKLHKYDEPISEKKKDKKPWLPKGVIDTGLTNYSGNRIRMHKDLAPIYLEALDTLEEEGINLQIEDSFRYKGVQKEQYEGSFGTAKEGLVAHPDSSYHVTGKAFDLAQIIEMRDNPRIAEVLSSLGLIQSRPDDEWWHWSTPN